MSNHWTLDFHIEIKDGPTTQGSVALELMDRIKTHSRIANFKMTLAPPSRLWVPGDSQVTSVSEDRASNYAPAKAEAPLADTLAGLDSKGALVLLLNPSRARWQALVAAGGKHNHYPPNHLSVIHLSLQARLDAMT